MGHKITIDPVTRVEGHARVTIQMDDNNEVAQTYLHIDQFRGFEKFSEGRLYFEMPSITPRICGICPVSHHLASAKACDAVAGVEPPRPATLLRQMLHMGQIVQSHALHFFHLASPDLLFGFDADPAIRNVAGLIEVNPDLALKAIRLRKYGQEVIRILSGRKIHMNWAVPGGVSAPLSEASRDAILAENAEMIGIAQLGLAVAKDWLSKNQDTVNRFANFSSMYMGMTNDGALELYDGPVRLIDAQGKKVVEYDPRDYLDYVQERSEDWTYLKYPYFKPMGWPQGVYRVAPLARLNIADRITTPLANEELKSFKALAEGPVQATLYYHYARLIEALYGLEQIQVLCDDPDILSEDILNTRIQITGHGVGAIEAPRGTLWHDYHTDENGVITRVNLIVATGNNNWAMSNAVDTVAKEYVKGSGVTEGMLNRVEAAIRAYDPCLSCSTHAVGQMPMIIEVVDAAGEPIERFVRD